MFSLSNLLFHLIFRSDSDRGRCFVAWVERGEGFDCRKRSTTAQQATATTTAATWMVEFIQSQSWFGGLDDFKYASFKGSYITHCVFICSFVFGVALGCVGMRCVAAWGWEEPPVLNQNNFENAFSSVFCIVCKKTLRIRWRKGIITLCHELFYSR